MLWKHVKACSILAKGEAYYDRTVLCRLCIFKKEVFNMMDLFLVGTLLAGFALVWLLLKWCSHQAESQE